MRDPYFHEQVLGIKSPWRVDDVRVDKQAKTVETHVVHEGQAQCPRCQADFFGSMKRELGDPVWESRAAARATIFEYIETWYNRRRRHSTLGYLSPEEYESRLPIAA